MNRERLLKKKEKVVTEIEFYDACSEIFRLLRDNQIEGLHLKNLEVAKKTIRKRDTYDVPNEGEWEAWTTMAKEGRNGSVRKPLFLSTGDEKLFVSQYNKFFRDAIREEIYQRNGKIVETPPKTR